MVSLRRAYINDTVLCGDRGFVVWARDRDDLGQCFLDLAFLLPAQVSSFRCDLLLMTIKHFSRHWGTSAYYLGFQAPPLLPENPAPTYRSTSWSVDQLEFGHPGDGPVAHHPSNDPLHPRPRLRHQSGSGGDPVQSCSDHCIAWSLHLMYTYLIYHSPSIRGPRPMLLLWSVCLLVNIMQVDSKKWLTKRNISIF